MTDTATPSERATRSLDAPGARLAYDLRPNPSSPKPTLFLIGSPMGASGFETLAGLITDRTIATYDPRGSERSQRTDGRILNTVAEHADDLSRVIAAISPTGPVDVFASSGGAINSLELVARHPEQVRVLVAHEPPDAAILPDRDAALAAVRHLGEVYQAGGYGAGMATFIALTSLRGTIPPDFASQPAPDPAMFGMPTEDDGRRDDPLLARNAGTALYEPDFEALRRASTRIVLAVGAASAELMTDRATREIARRLGTEVEVFPGGHGGFNRSPWDPTADPEAFAAKLREILDR